MIQKSIRSITSCSEAGKFLQVLLWTLNWQCLQNRPNRLGGVWFRKRCWCLRLSYWSESNLNKSTFHFGPQVCQRPKFLSFGAKREKGKLRHKSYLIEMGHMSKNLKPWAFACNWVAGQWSVMEELHREKPTFSSSVIHTGSFPSNWTRRSEFKSRSYLRGVWSSCPIGFALPNETMDSKTAKSFKFILVRERRTWFAQIG